MQNTGVSFTLTGSAQRDLEFGLERLRLVREQAEPVAVAARVPEDLVFAVLRCAVRARRQIRFALCRTIGVFDDVHGLPLVMEESVEPATDIWGQWAMMGP
jgi:hypothetical protein